MIKIRYFIVANHTFYHPIKIIFVINKTINKTVPGNNEV
jgi:hypothetical protein